MATKFDVDKWVHDVAISRVDMFYPTLVSKEIGLPLQEVFERLMILVSVGHVYVKWEVRCHTYGCHRTLFWMNTPAEKLGEIICCDFCGEEIEIDFHNVFPVFGVTSDYKVSIKKNNDATKRRFQRSSQPISFANLLSPEVLQMIQRLYPDDYTKVFIQINQGDGIMSEKVTKIGDNFTNKGIVSTGDYNVNTVNINEQKMQEFHKLTDEFLQSIDRSDIEMRKKEQLRECVQSIADEVSKNEPKKATIGMMLQGLDLIIKPTELGPALEKWEQWINWITNNIIGG